MGWNITFLGIANTLTNIISLEYRCKQMLQVSVFHHVFTFYFTVLSLYQAT